MTFRVLIEEQAALDIAAYGQWIVDQGSPENALRWVISIEHAIETLASMPERCAIAPEAEVFNLEIRQLLFKSHRVLFVVEETTVHVLHVRHGARESLDSTESDTFS